MGLGERLVGAWESTGGSIAKHVVRAGWRISLQELRTVVGIDQDPMALGIAEDKLRAAAAGRSDALELKLVKSNFRSAAL